MVNFSAVAIFLSGEEKQSHDSNQTCLYFTMFATYKRHSGAIQLKI